MRAAAAECIATPEPGALLVGPMKPAEGVHDELFARALQDVWPTRHEVPIRLEIEGEAAQVAMSPERLSQVLENLVDNAVSFSPEGGDVDVHIDASSSPVRVDVLDRGPGVPEEHREKAIAV